MMKAKILASVFAMGMVLVGATPGAQAGDKKKGHGIRFDKKELGYALKCVNHASNCRDAIKAHAGSCSYSKDDMVDTLVKHGAVALMTGGASLMLSLSAEQAKQLNCVLDKAGPHIKKK